MATGRRTVVVGQVIDPDTWGNPLWDQSVQQFASAADRTAQFPAPIKGAVTWLDDLAHLEVWDGTTWRPLAVDLSGTYTPALTNITLGNGTVTGRWWVAGRLLHAEVLVTWGSTTTSASPIFAGIPPALVPAIANQSPVGLWTVFDVSAAAVRVGFMVRSGATGVCRNADGTSIGGATVPITWATGDQLYVEFAYPLVSAALLAALLEAIADGDLILGGADQVPA